MKKFIAIACLVGYFLVASGVITIAMTLAMRLIIMGLETSDSLLFGLGICAAGALIVGLSVFFIGGTK